MEEVAAIERALLSGFLRDRYLLGRALDAGFSSDLMPHALGRTLARTLVEIYGQKDVPLEPVTLRALLAERGALSPELRKFLDTVQATAEPDAAQVMAYVEILRARAARLRLVEVNTQISRYLDEERTEGKDLVDFVGGLIPALLDIQRQRLASTMPSISDVGNHLVRDMLSGMGGALGYRIGPFERLTASLSGLRRGFYYGLAGAPRRGKTNFGLEIASTIAAQHRIPVLYFSWEQTNRVLFTRLLGKEMLTNPTSLLAPGLDPQLQGSLRDVWNRLESELATLYIFEGGRHDTVDRIRARAHNLMHALQTDECVICIDYLQRVPLEEPVHDEKTRTDLISGKLTDLSLELNCPVFAISPLDKEGCRLDERPSDELSEFARPTMHHSVGSGDLEYDLDVAMVLSKDWVATKNLEDLLRTEMAGRNGEATPPRIDVLDLHLDKNRDAPETVASTIQYAFFVSLNKFVELGYKTSEHFGGGFRDFARMQEALHQLRRRGLIHAAPPEGLRTE